jgi:hypothetical protein
LTIHSITAPTSLKGPIFSTPRHADQDFSTPRAGLGAARHAHDQIANVFSRRPNLDAAIKFRSAHNQAFTRWDEVTGVAVAASSRLSPAATQSIAPATIASMTS